MKYGRTDAVLHALGHAYSTCALMAETCRIAGGNPGTGRRPLCSTDRARGNGVTSVLSPGNVGKACSTGGHEVRAHQDVRLDGEEGECRAVVEETGSGRTTPAKRILSNVRLNSGQIVFNGEKLPVRRRLRHRRAIQLVQQTPLSCLNPKRSVGASIWLRQEVCRMGSSAERWNQVEAALVVVGLPAGFRSALPGLYQVVSASEIRWLAPWSASGDLFSMSPILR